MTSKQKPGTEPDFEKLVKNAENDAVSVEKLTGDERYYPDASGVFEWPNRVNDETLQYLVLLTKGTHYKSESTVTDIYSGMNGIGSLVFTERAFYHAHTEKFYREYPYDVITRTWVDFDDRTITVYFDGVEHEFTFALRSDEENVKEAYSYLRYKVTEY